MFEKMIGVSPPQVGKAQDSKVANQKDFRDTAESKSKYKSDFEKALQEKDQHKSDKHAEPEKKHTVAKKESGADKKDKKSSGGIKKKMTSVDDKMVSNGMASSENEVETPVDQADEPAKIKIDTQLAKDKPAVDANSAKDSILAGKALDEALQKLKGEEAKDGEMESLKKGKSEGEAAAANATAAKDQSIDAQLGAAVGFKPNAEMAKANKDLMSKLKEFEGEAKSGDASTNSFEKNVLSTLQKENSSSGQF